MKALLAIPPNPSDATSFYRCGGPFGELNQRFDNFHIFVTELGDKLIGDKIHNHTATMLQRPFHDSHLQFAKMVKRANRPLWVDYDDDLFEVPKDNPTHDQYTDPKIKRNMAEIVSMADIITVTTHALKEKLTLGAFKDKDVRVVPNAFDFRRFPQRPLEERKGIVLWRGSQTHQKDVLTVAPQLIHASHKWQKFVFSFVGATQWLVTEQMNQKNLVDHKALSIDEYLEAIEKMAPLVFIVPLNNSRFNKAKSNIAFLEATYAGAITIAPNFEEWKVPGCLNYESPEHFGQLLDEVLEGKHSGAWKTANEWVRANRSLEVVNNAREKIVREMCKL